MIYLNIDENKYLLSVATVGGGIAADIDLEKYDLSDDRIRAHKWENDTLTFDADRYAEILAEKEKEETPDAEQTAEASVYDELAAAYKEGVQEA